MKTVIAVGLLLSLVSLSSAKDICTVSVCNTPGGCTLTRSTLLQTLPNLNKEFLVSVEILPLSWKVAASGNSNNGPYNVIHLTQGGNVKYGDRIPGVWAKPTGQLELGFSINGQVNGGAQYEITTAKKYPLNQWIKVQFSQTLENGKYMYRVLVNGERLTNVVNNKPQTFSNVKVYAADPWYLTLKGSIRNLMINAVNSKPCGGGNPIPDGIRPISGCVCSDQKQQNHLGGNIGACLTTLKGKHWCYLVDNESSKCPDKKKSSRPGNLWWGYEACKWYTEFEPNTGK